MSGILGFGPEEPEDAAVEALPVGGVAILLVEADMASEDSDDLAIFSCVPSQARQVEVISPPIDVSMMPSRLSLDKGSTGRTISRWSGLEVRGLEFGSGNAVMIYSRSKA